MKIKCAIDIMEMTLIDMWCFISPHNHQPMKLLIKNMVSRRCKMIVEAELTALGLTFCTVELGEVETGRDLTPGELAQLKHELLKTGLEIMDDNKTILIEKIKNIIVELIHFKEEASLC
jgi:hypothetical protein